jgi:rsbT co-antagonist protein RsbR
MIKDGTAGEVASASASDAASEDVGALRTENATLRARVAELERRQGEAAIRESQELLRAIVDNSATVIFVKDLEGRLILTNRRFDNLFHITEAEALGKNDHYFFPPHIAEQVHANDLLVMETRAPLELEEVVQTDAGLQTYFSVKFPILDRGGAIVGVCGIATDITERKLAEQAQAELQQQIIETQRASLRELSTPLIPLAEGVLAMPLIGSIDSSRAQQITETLLHGIAVQRARIAILDITGVKAMDTQLADVVMRAARSAKLLGAEVVLTGISASAAMVLVEIGADLSGVRTLGTLQGGIAYALGR